MQSQFSVQLNSMSSPKRSAEDTDDLNVTPTKKSKPGTPRQRKAPSTPVANSRSIPRSIDECNAEDKMLIERRDAGVSWGDIRAEWEQMTGDKVGNSTLPNRYVRLKANICVIAEEDNTRMLDAKVEIEQKFERDKWSLIAQSIEAKGGKTYSTQALQRQFKKVMAEANTAPMLGAIQEAEDDEE